MQDVGERVQWRIYTQVQCFLGFGQEEKAVLVALSRLDPDNLRIVSSSPGTSIFPQQSCLAGGTVFSLRFESLSPTTGVNLFLLGLFNKGVFFPDRFLIEQRHLYMLSVFPGFGQERQCNQCT